MHAYLIFIISRVNDCIVKINNIDVSNVDRKTAIEAIRNCNGSASLVINFNHLVIFQIINLVFSLVPFVSFNPLSPNL